MDILRRKTRTIVVREIAIGSSAPVSVQAMTKAPAEDVRGTLAQIKRLQELGAPIVRLAVPNAAALTAFAKIRAKTNAALVADIHFDWRLALGAISAGADKIRLNPGNITDVDGVIKVIREAKRKRIPIRIGVNSGSVRTRVKNQTGEVAPKEMVAAAVKYIRFFEKQNFRDIVISLKTSDAASTIESYRLLARECDYPFHLGVTAAGPPEESLLKSAIGIGGLLAMGIGDTIRVSMTGPPEPEVTAAYDILRAVGLHHSGPEIISCPTCGRCQIDLPAIVRKVKAGLTKIKRPIRVAVMGCVVNGPGEAKEADIGIAGGKGFGFLFKKGKLLRKIDEKDFVRVLLAEARKL